MTRPDSLPDYRWDVHPSPPDKFLRHFRHIHPVMLTTLYHRGLEEPATIQAFLEGRYLHSRDPFLLPDMEPAVARIQQAIEHDETIVVYGDFDADGVTATVLLVQALRGLGLDRSRAQPYIPDRVDEGYGLNADALTSLRQEKGADLVITVDCGIRAVAEVEHAGAMGLDMIITDHHSLGKELPPAVAIINPKHPDSQYPERSLAGVGIAFKLAQALRLAMPERASYQDEDFLDLVAIGTVADLAPLRAENRILVQEGLRVLNNGRRLRPGLHALMHVSGVSPGGVRADAIGFRLGPRINAAGRLAHAYDAAKLLAVNNQLQATRYANRLNTLNQQRQQMTRTMGALAEKMIDPDAPVLVAADEEFNPGIVGLVASRLAEKYYRPAIVLEKGEGFSHGSCRSIPEVHITQALDAVSELLVRYGGHAQAAGFTIANQHIVDFGQRLHQVIGSQLEGKDLRPVLTIDSEIKLDQIDWALYEQLEQLEPTGVDNPTPIFTTRNVQMASPRAVGHDQAHLKFAAVADNVDHACIAFRQGAWLQQLPERVDLAYTIQVNEWQGRRTLQLLVKDIRATQG